MTKMRQGCYSGGQKNKQHGLERFDRLIYELNELLQKKAIKSFTYNCEHQVSLLIRNGKVIDRITWNKSIILLR